jgi:hypothetical protein
MRVVVIRHWACSLLAARRGQTGRPRESSHHGGFLGGELGEMGQPDAFAARLRQVIDEACLPA